MRRRLPGRQGGNECRSGDSVPGCRGRSPRPAGRGRVPAAACRGNPELRGLQMASPSGPAGMPASAC